MAVGQKTDYDTSRPAFVTYGWCRTAYAVVRSLARAGVEVHVGDASRLAMARYSRYCRSFHRLPDFFSQPDEYVAAVLAAMRKCGAQVLLPCHEDVGVFAARAEQLGEVEVALPSWARYQEAEDKLRLMEMAPEVDCPVPVSCRVTGLDELEGLAERTGWPTVIKTRIGNSAKGVLVAQDAAGLREGFAKITETYGIEQAHWPFLQEFLPGRPVGVCAIFDRGRCRATFAEEYLRCKEGGIFGTSTYRSTVEAPAAAAAGVRVLEKLDWHGIAHLDFIQDGAGQYKLIEINPRPWGALWLAVAGGVDFPLMWYLLATGQEVAAPGPVEQPVYCRWVLGDMLALVKLLAAGRLGKAAGVLRPRWGGASDDFNLWDPLPFLAQGLDYTAKMIRAGGTNPASEGMIR